MKLCPQDQLNEDYHRNSRPTQHLLDILHELMDDLKIKLVVAHYNHGLRQAEDESETQFVRHLAASMNLPFQTEKASLSIEGSTASLEEKARNARYEFLEKVRDRYHAQKIAVERIN